jgi:hypothetical protein
MGGVVGNRALQGSPILPYPIWRASAGTDCFLDMIFVDHTDTPVVPTAMVWQVDDITNDVNMIPPTTISDWTGYTAGETYTLQLPGQQMVMTFPYAGSQLAQISGEFTAVDSVTGKSFTAAFIRVVELAAIQTPSNLSIWTL